MENEVLISTRFQRIWMKFTKVLDHGLSNGFVSFSKCEEMDFSSPKVACFRKMTVRMSFSTYVGSKSFTNVKGVVVHLFHGFGIVQFWFYGS